MHVFIPVLLVLATWWGTPVQPEPSPCPVPHWTVAKRVKKYETARYWADGRWHWTREGHSHCFDHVADLRELHTMGCTGPACPVHGTDITNEQPSYILYPDWRPDHDG